MQLGGFCSLAMLPCALTRKTGATHIFEMQPSSGEICLTRSNNASSGGVDCAFTCHCEQPNAVKAVDFINKVTFEAALRETAVPQVFIIVVPVDVVTSSAETACCSLLLAQLDAALFSPLLLAPAAFPCFFHILAQQHLVLCFLPCFAL